MKTHKDYLNKLSPARRQKIEARTQELVAEEMSLRDLRKARKQSQETVADLLGMRQGDVSKLERRTDAYLSTLRRYVEAMGGELQLIAKFPDRPPVKILHIGDLAEESENSIDSEHLQHA